MNGKLYLFLTGFLVWAPMMAAQDALQEEAESQDTLNAARLETVFENVEELENLEVTVTNGVVRLVGNATSEEHREQAESVARGLPDVIYVDNDIEISGELSEQLSPSVTRFNALVEKVRRLLPLLGIALFLMVFFVLLARMLGWLFLKSPLLKRNRLLRGIVENVLKLVVIGAGLYLALEILGATAIVGAVLGAAGVAGLAISFAFRDIIENFLASVLLSLRQPFRIKDTVEVNGSLGKVVRLTSSETVLMTPDGNHVRIPNADVFKGKVVNYTRNPERRFDVEVGVGMEEDLLLAEEVGLQTLRELPGVLEDPSPTCLVAALGDSSVSLRFYGWIDQSVTDFGKVRSQAIRLIKVVFDSEDIEMPNPTFEVNMREVKEKAAYSRVVEDHERQRAHELIEEVRHADISPDTHIDEQIDDEKESEGDEDLLDEESVVVKPVESLPKEKTD